MDKKGERNPECIVLVTGCSGAGKSSVLRSLEDTGYFCVDNMPLELLDSFLGIGEQTEHIGTNIALGVDIRTVASIEQCMQVVTALKARLGMRFMLLFVSSSTPVLIKRFQETRRKHPLSDTATLTEAIEYEKELLKPLSQGADHHIVTDGLTIGQLRRRISSLCVQGAAQHIVVNFMSFGFKYGIPLESNFIWDVRSLPNPYFMPALRDFTGKDSEIQDYLFAQHAVQEYWQRLAAFIEFAIIAAHQEGRSSITLAVGCTGGRHRSVALIERLGKEQFEHAASSIMHRDIGRDMYIREKG